MNYLQTFPNYDRKLIEIEGFQDTSWKNDACPSISKGRIQVYCNYLDPKKREIEDSSLYYCFLYSKNQKGFDEPIKELGTDNISDVLDFIKQNEEK